MEILFALIPPQLYYPVPIYSRQLHPDRGMNNHAIFHKYMFFPFINSVPIEKRNVASIDFKFVSCFMELNNLIASAQLKHMLNFVLCCWQYSFICIVIAYFKSTGCYNF
jgi:hypothetical protein